VTLQIDPEFQRAWGDACLAIASDTDCESLV
jgi:hypothetical protein